MKKSSSTPSKPKLQANKTTSTETSSKSWLERIDKLDKRVSLYFHNLNWRIFEAMLLPYAVIHNPWGLVFLWQVITWYLCPQNAALEFKAVTLEEKLSMMLNYATYVLLTAPVTNFLKKETARRRPTNPEKGAHNSRYFDLRGHENNYSMPSGDTT